MILMGIDPGPLESGWIVWDTVKEEVLECGISPNKLIRISIESTVKEWDIDVVLIEMIASYGMAVGESVFETCVEIGKFDYCIHMIFHSPKVILIKRRDVKLRLCGNARAKDTNIHQRLVDMYGKPGTKKNPGKLYGVKSHIWSALALCIAYQEELREAEFKVLDKVMLKYVKTEREVRR